MTQVGQMAKAIAAACSAAAATLVTASAQDGISGAELAIVVIGTVGAFAAVFATPNAAAK